MLPVEFANARKTTPCAAFSQFYFLLANEAILKTTLFARACKQPVCALGNRLINTQQIVPM
jgi:hypothetical protein